MLEDHTAPAARLPVQPAPQRHLRRLPQGGPAAAPPAEAAWPESYPSGYAVVDVETTGLAPGDRIVSAAVYRLTARGEVEDHWYTLVNPQRDPGPTWLHGLTREMLADAPVFAEIAGEFSARLAGRVLVAHNAVFDWTMIAREYARAAHTPPVEQRLCTILLAKALELPLPNHKLESLAAYFGVEQRQAHHALDDARVLAEAFRPSLLEAARQRLALPLTRCRPITEWSETGTAGGRAVRWGGRRPAKRRPACPYPNPGRYQAGGPLRQGMRVAFSGDTSTDRELLEDQAFAAGLHIASSVSRLTSLLVTNYPEARTSKVTRARELGTPIVDEAAFTRLLREVAPAEPGPTGQDAAEAPPMREE